MNPPRRWLDDPSRAPDGALELLREAETSTAPSPESLARVADGVAASTTWNAPWYRALGVKSLGAAVGLAAVVAAVWPAPARPRADLAPRRDVAVVSTRVATPTTVANPTPDAPVAPTPAVIEAPSVRASAPPRRRPPTARAPSGRDAVTPPPPRAVDEAPVVAARGGAPAAAVDRETLAREAAWLERVRAQLATSPDEVLAQLRQHATLFPRGQLAEEAAYLRFEALRRSGRVDEARRFADAWIAAHPHGLYADPMRRAAESLATNGPSSVRN